MYDVKTLNIWKSDDAGSYTIANYKSAKISCLKLSVRSFGCLKRAGCETVGDVLKLVQEDEDGLRRIRNLGRRSEAEIKRKIDEFKNGL